MSKAFTKDSEDDGAVVIPPRAALPDGTPNYVTLGGLRALRREHAALLEERARADARPEDDPDRTRALSILGGRLAALEDRLATAETVTSTPQDLVRFGATVVLRDENDAQRTYRIVGVDQAAVEDGLLAFVSPLARALLGHRAGDVVEVRTPRGREEMTVVEVTYADDATGPPVER